MSAHIGLEELADSAGGVLDSDRNRVVEAHVRGCALCADTYQALTEVTQVLASEPTPGMPPEVAQRLAQAIGQESRLRSSTTRPGVEGASSQHLQRSWSYVRPTLGSSFGADLPHRSRTRMIGLTAAACAVAGIVGFAGYVLSASAGLNEPPATAPAVVSSGSLGPEAHAIEQHDDLSPHRFSAAWQCARDVTDGRITAITSAVVDGQPALLVYLSDDDRTSVTVVTGCGSGKPVAGASTTLPG